MTCLVRNWSVVPAHCSRPARDRHAWSDQGRSRFRFAQNPVATGSGATLLVEAGHLIMENRPVLPPRADDQILIYRSRRSSAHNGSRGYEARHSVRLIVDRVSVESRKGISTRSLAAHEA
jgi:hypothetical protein